MATMRETRKREERVQYLRALFNLESAQKVVEKSPDDPHHQVRHREAARDLLDILLREMTTEAR